jgi:hypothetical protein
MKIRRGVAGVGDGWEQHRVRQTDTSKPDQARDRLTVATTMYREMGMRFWLEQAEAEMRKLQQSSWTLPNSKDW